MRFVRGYRLLADLVLPGLPVGLLADLPPDLLEVRELPGGAVEELCPLLAGVVVQLEY